MLHDMLHINFNSLRKKATLTKNNNYSSQYGKKQKEYIMSITWFFIGVIMGSIVTNSLTVSIAIGIVMSILFAERKR